MARAGAKEAGFSEAADFYIINTCTVTQNADLKSKEAVLRARKENPHAKIAACGCLAEFNQDFLKKLKVDFIIPQSKKGNFLALAGFKKVYRPPYIERTVASFFRQRVFVKIQDGCDNACTFCKIPYIRGKSRSKPHSVVLEEISRLGEKFKEIVLCGVNLGLWGRDFTSPLKLEDLLEAVLGIKGDFRLRLSSLEPNLISPKLISLFSNSRLCPHLHLPFQSGDDEILKLMNKKETTGLYYSLVEELRRSNPNFAISADIMVGFPYEKEDNFNNTLAFLEKVKPMRLHIFRFSPRDKTPLAKAKQFSADIVSKRYKILSRLKEKFSFDYRRRFLGKNLEVVLEEEKGGYFLGYSENYIRVKIPSQKSLTSGEWARVKVKKVTLTDTLGEIK